MMIRLVTCLLVPMAMVTSLPTEDDYHYQYPEVQNASFMLVNKIYVKDYNVQDYLDDDDPESIEEEIVSLDKPDFVSVGGLIVVHEGGKVVIPCQVNGLGGRQVGGGHGGHGGHDGHTNILSSFFRHSGPKCLEQLQKKTSCL